MTNSTLKSVEERVLDVYQRVNPSIRYIESDKVLFDEIRRNREQLFWHRLKLPRKLFKDARLISFGSGTGEYEIYYGMWGCKEISCVEMNDISMERLIALFHHFNLDPILKKTHIKSYFNVDLGKDKFDFVIADGTIVHTDDPLEAVRRFCLYVAEDGFIVIGSAELSGMVQRNIQRVILYCMAGNDEKKIVEYAKILFDEHIQRSVKYGKRSEEAIIYDSYVNPKIKAPSIIQLLEVFSENDIHFYSSYPAVAPVVLTSSFRDTLMHMENRAVYPLLLPFLVAWVLADEKDNAVLKESFSTWKELLDVFNGFLMPLFDITPESADVAVLLKAHRELDRFIKKDFIMPLKVFFQKRLVEFSQDISKLVAAIQSKDLGKIRALEFKRLLKGTCGVGNMYLVGSKAGRDSQ